MPPEPIEYQIVKNLQAAVLAIAVAGGYHYDVSALAVKLDPNQNVEDLLLPDGPRPFVILELKPESWEYFPASQVRLMLTPTVWWVQDADPTVDESRLQTYLRGCADVERAIAVDVTRGGLAVDTRIARRELHSIGGGAQVWAAVDLEIPLHRTFGSPDV